MDPNRMGGMGDAYGNYYGGPPLGAGRDRGFGRGYGHASGPPTRNRRDQGGRGYLGIDNLDRGYNSRPGEADEIGQFGGYDGRGRSAHTEFDIHGGRYSRELLVRPQASHGISEISRGRVRRNPSERARLHRELEEKYPSVDGGYLIGDPLPSDFEPEPTEEDVARNIQRKKEMDKERDDYEKKHGRPWGCRHWTKKEYEEEEAKWESG